jgi:hypothetical protein
MHVKVYLVLKATPAGEMTGEIVAAKLTRGAAQSIAKAHAPCKVELLWADKSPDLNGPSSQQRSGQHGFEGSHPRGNVRLPVR